MDRVWPESDAAGSGAAGRLWSLTRGKHGSMAIVAAIATAAAALEMGVAALASLTMGALVAMDRSGALLWSAGIVGAVALSCILQTASNLLTHRVAIDIQAETRFSIGRKLWSAPLGAIQRIDAAELRRTLMEDVERIEDGIAHLVPDFVAALVAPLFIGIAMLVVDWRLALAVFLPILAGFGILSFILRGDGGLSARFVAAQAGVDAALQEAVRMVPVIKAYGMAPEDLSRAENAFRELDGAVDGCLAFAASSTNWFLLATTSSLVFVAPLGLWLYALPEDIAVLMFFLLGAFFLSSVAARLFGAMGRLRIQEASLARVDAVLQLPDLSFIEGSPKDGDSIRFDSVGFSHGNGFALEDIDLEIGAGQKVAFVGPSGSGKTTLAHLLLRSFDPERGRITFSGRDIRSFAQSELATYFTAVFQENFLFSQTIRANIAIGRPGASDEEIVEAARLSRADDFIRALPAGYDTVVHRGEGLSGGQKQRIAIARAFLKNAPIILLDEAAAYLDPDGQHEVQDALNTLAKDRTVVAIAHRLSSVCDFDRIFYMEGGRIVESGPHEVLMALGGAYARQWRSHTAARSFTLRTGERPDGRA